jgi:hypothetical protein
VSLGKLKHAPAESNRRSALGVANQSGQLCSSGKVCFASMAAAEERARASRAQSHIQIYAYACEECGLFHHTKSARGKAPPPPTRTRAVSLDKITRITRMLIEADGLAVDALLAYPKGHTAVALEACRLACAEAVSVRAELVREAVDDIERSELKIALVDALANAYGRVDMKRTALGRLVSA